MYDVTKLVTPRVYTKLLKLMPEPKQKKLGRKRCSKEALLNGILQVLVNGVAWKKIASCGASPSSCHRYFQEMQRRGQLKLVFDTLQREGTDVLEGAIDTTSITSFRFRQLTGWDGRHKKVATKLSIFTDINGLPVDILFGKGNRHDLRFLPEHVGNTFGRRTKTLNCDKIYTSVKLRRKMRKRGTYLNMEMRRGDYVRKRGPKFKFDKDKYKVRFLVERLNGWIKSFRRLRLRREYRVAMFKAFVYLALIIILIRS